MRKRRGGLLLVAACLAVEVSVAGAALADSRPVRYGWQMYSGLTYVPRAWSVFGNIESELHLDGLMLHARSEIDYVDLLLARGCELFDAEALRIELGDGTGTEVSCR